MVGETRRSVSTVPVSASSSLGVRGFDVRTITVFVVLPLSFVVSSDTFTQAICPPRTVRPSTSLIVQPHEDVAPCSCTAARPTFWSAN